MSTSIELRGTGLSWAGYRGNERVTPFRSRPEQAAQLIEKLNHATQVKERDCMCCGARFESEGKHNRLCSTCRTRNRGLI